MAALFYVAGTAMTVLASLVFVTGHTLASAGLMVAAVMLYAGAIITVEK